MSDRSVSVFLNATVTGFLAGMEKAKLATTDLAKSAEKSATQHRQSWDKVGKGMLLTGGVIAAGVVLAVKAFADFDKQMGNVKAVSNASATQMEKLAKAAIKAGADTVFSASEAAKAEGELAKAGVKTSDILGGALTGSLNLASAGGLDLANAATIAAQSMNIFKLGGKDVSHIADVLAAGANKSAADVGSLGDALKQGGLVAAQTGLHLEDTVGTLSMFADSALVGSDAGTSLKTMLMRLVPSSDAAQTAMDSIGFSAYDAQGKFVGMASVAEQLKTGLGGLTEKQRASTLNTIFGSDATRAASILYEKGAAGVRDYTSAVNDQGAASRMAATMLNNLSGDFEGLKGSIDTALIQSGSAGNDVLRGLVQGATKAVNAFGNLPDPVQKSAVGFAAVTSAGLLLVGGFLTVVPKIIETRKALEALHITSGRTGAALKGLGKAAGIATVLAAAAAAASAFDTANTRAVPGIEATTAALLKTGDAAGNVDALFKGMDTGSFLGSANRPVDDLAAAFKRLTNKDGIDSFSDSVDGLFGRINGGTQSAAVFNNIGTALGTLVTSGHADLAKKQFDAMAKKLGLSGDAVNRLRDLMPGYDEALAGAANAADLAGQATGSAAKGADGLTAAQRKLAAAAGDAKKALDAEVQSLQDAGLVVLSTRSATRDLIQAQVDATAALHKNGKGLSNNSVKGRENAAALDAVASKALSLADSIYKETGSEAKMRASLVSSRGSLIKTYLQFDNNIGRARAYADSILKIPKQHLTQLQIDKAAADAKIVVLQKKIDSVKQGKVPGITANSKAGRAIIAGFQKQIDVLHGKTIVVKAGFSFASAGFPGKVTPPKSAVFPATGGHISGPGSGTSDSIPAMLSNGEYVINASQTAKHRPLLDAINSGAQGFAGGGQVGSTINIKLPSLDAIRAALTIRVPDMGGGGGGMAGAGVQRWLPVVLQALGLTGQPASLAQTLLRRMNQESGGNPNAINMTDSNARAGHPSQGLMQTIPGTFNHYRMPGLSSSITDPLSNIVAAIRYALSSYGSLAAAFNRAGGYANGTDSAAPGLAWVGEHGKELLDFRGGERVIPNHHLAGGGLVQNFASGGFVSADFSAMSSGMSNPTIPSKGALSAALIRQQKATTALHVAENNLYTLRRTKGHTAAQIRIDEERLATARASLSTATRTLRGIEAARSGKPQPFVTQFHASAGKANRQTERFLFNIGWLGRHGYRVLADQLLMAGDAQAYALAEGAVKNAGTARALSADMARSVKNQKALTTAQDAVNARYSAVPAQPAWALPTGVAASTYGARPAPARIQSIVVKIGDKELTTLISTTVDGHTQSLVDALVYGGGG